MQATTQIARWEKDNEVIREIQKLMAQMGMDEPGITPSEIMQYIQTRIKDPFKRAKLAEALQEQVRNQASMASYTRAISRTTRASTGNSLLESIRRRKDEI